MLDTRHANPPHSATARRRPILTALRCLFPKQQQALARPVAAAIEQIIPGSDDHAMPAIVLRMREDANCRSRLARLGYFNVRSEYARYKREGRDTFAGVDHEFVAPTMEFVGDWLSEERKRVLARTRWTFLITMVGTIAAGIAFVAVAAVLGH
jgi:hypothetical protein